MTAKEAIQTIEAAKAEVEWNYPLDYAAAFEVAIEALEKQIPKKPIPQEGQHIRYSMNYTCPSCERFFIGTGIANYCYHCGQRLEWGDDE